MLNPDGAAPQREITIHDIPSELMTEIIVFLDPLEINELSLVCTQFRDAIRKHDELIWKRRLYPHEREYKTLSDYIEDNSQALDRVMLSPSWRFIYFFAYRDIYRFDTADSREDIVISDDRSNVKTGIVPATKLQQQFRRLLLYPGFPRSSQATYALHVNIDLSGIGLWLGVSRKNFKTHTWLGDEDDSWGWGNECCEFYWNFTDLQNRIITETDLGYFVTGDVVSLIVEMDKKTLQFIKNGKEGCLLDLNKIIGEDDLHFSVVLYESPMAVTLLQKGYQEPPEDVSTEQATRSTQSDLISEI